MLANYNIFVLHPCYTLSCLHTEAESTKYRSRLPTSPGDQHDSRQQEPYTDTDRQTSARLTCDPGSDRKSVFHRFGYRHRKDDVTSSAHDTDDQKKYDLRRRSGKYEHEEQEQMKIYHRDMVRKQCRRLPEEKPSQEQTSRSLIKVDQKDKRQGGLQLMEHLEQLSVGVTCGDNSSSELEDESSTAQSQYQDVLTRHINQLFLRGDNVALVSVLR